MQQPTSAPGSGRNPLRVDSATRKLQTAQFQNHSQLSSSACPRPCSTASRSMASGNNRALPSSLQSPSDDDGGEGAPAK
ncbi:hypothetical protein EJB05_42860, partial [Eragrostis curvula]